MSRTLPARFFGTTKQNGEARFAAAVMRYLRQLYGSRMWETAIRGGLGQRSGIPDRLLCLDGQFVGIEFKEPGGRGRLGPKQALEIEAIQAAGGMAVIVDSWEALQPILDRFPPAQMQMRRKA